MGKTREPHQKNNSSDDAVTSFQDEHGRNCDAIRHQPCGGKGCDLCNDLGFIIQMRLEFPDNLAPDITP